MNLNAPHAVGQNQQKLFEIFFSVYFFFRIHVYALTFYANYLRGDNLHEKSKGYFSGENNINLSSADIVLRV